MTTTRTTSELQAALEQQRELRDRIAAGDTKVTPRDLTDVQGRIELARLRAEVVADADAEAREQQRLDRIDALRDELHDGTLHSAADRILELYGQARVLLAELHSAAEAYQQRLHATARELLALEPLPDSVEVDVGSGRMYVDGVMWAYKDTSFADMLVADLARSEITELRAFSRVAERRRDSSPEHAALMRQVTAVANRDSFAPSVRVTVRFLREHWRRRPGTIQTMRWREAQGLVEQGIAALLQPEDEVQNDEHTPVGAGARISVRPLLRPSL